MTRPARIRIVEVGPRDGLQNEAASLSVTDKIAFVDQLTNAGHTAIEVGAFVSPRSVPQMAARRRCSPASAAVTASAIRRSCRM